MEVEKRATAARAEAAAAHLAELKESRAQWLREQVAREGRRLKEEKERDDAAAAAVSTQQQKRRDQLKEPATRPRRRCAGCVWR